MARIGIFGYYQAGNFGDDLMAVMIAKRLSQYGHTPKIFGIDASVANRVGATSTSSVEGLIEDCDMCVIGGGHWLANYHGLKAGNYQRESDHNLWKLVRLCLSTKTPCSAISIGGDQRGLDRGVRTGFMGFMLSPMFQGATTRLGSDAEFVRHVLVHMESNARDDVHDFPDIVFDVAREFKHELADSRTGAKGRKGCLQLGVHLVASSLVLPLWIWAQMHPHIQITWMHNSVAEKLRFNERFPFIREDAGFHDADPVEYLRKLQNMDLLIGCRLHLGIAALALGIPFFAVNAENKTKLALEELGCDHLIYDVPKRHIVTFIKDVQDALMGGDESIRVPSNIAAVRSASAGHLEWLLRHVQGCDGG